MLGTCAYNLFRQLQTLTRKVKSLVEPQPEESSGLGRIRQLRLKNMSMDVEAILAGSAKHKIKNSKKAAVLSRFRCTRIQAPIELYQSSQ